MVSKVSMFPVDNGDMTLIETESGKKILIDINIRVAADDPDDDTPDVARMLRQRLDRDAKGRFYVDAMLVSHPDKDHCTGLRKHFHLGLPEEWSEQADRILIREIWSSPMAFRRASRKHTLCDDAEAFTAEVRRRVQRFRSTGGIVDDGNRVLVLGEDENGKTADLGAILVRLDETFTTINGQDDWSMSARLLGPLPVSDDEDEEEALAKNRSSTILQFTLAGDGLADRCRFLTGGDAEVGIWERLWHRHSWRADWLSYDILQTPHHCSWHSLSYDSWGDLGEEAEICDDARKALAQARAGATIVSSSKPIKDDDSDPPCIRAKREYVAIARDAIGSFKCVGEYPSERSPDVMEFEIGRHGPRLLTKLMTAPAVVSSGLVGRQPLAHG